MLSKSVEFLLRVYRAVVSPVLHALAGPGFGCRFEPTCSQHMAEAVRTQGWFRGIGMGLRRLSRCHPFASE